MVNSNNTYAGMHVHKYNADESSAIVSRSRKRRTSNSQEDFKEDHMNECTAALVLMSLSCSPNSSLNGSNWIEQQPLSPSASFSDCASWRSGTPSPPLSESGNSGIWGSVGTDEGIVLDEDYYDEHPRKRKRDVTSRTLARPPLPLSPPLPPPPWPSAIRKGTGAYIQTVAAIALSLLSCQLQPSRNANSSGPAYVPAGRPAGFTAAAAKRNFLPKATIHRHTGTRPAHEPLRRSVVGLRLERPPPSAPSIASLSSSPSSEGRRRDAAASRIACVAYRDADAFDRANGLDDSS
ncbi:hypothetical protein V9T40_004774 [Parthenolecanium corni]|uniref:Uncharacterized protein n=1 Tax=Parthenolecanium corni TaxID=536013 RepID=A0AAN9TEG8_9HEMI